MTVAMILAAGLGTRLRPLTDELPKPLVPVGDAPLVVQIQRHLAAHGVDRVVMNTHHRHEAFERVTFPLPTTTAHEPEILGTAGGIAGARPLLDTADREPVLVWNGDILGAIDVSELVDQHNVNGGDVDATWVVAPRECGEGNVGLDADGFVVRVRNFREARGVDEVSSADFLGVQMLSARVMAELPETGCLIGDVLGPRMTRAARTVATVAYDGRWFDVGTPAAYLDANLAWLAARGLPWLDRRDERDANESITLAASILGVGTRVTGQGHLERVVAWPGATVDAPLRSAIVTPHHLLRI